MNGRWKCYVTSCLLLLATAHGGGSSSGGTCEQATHELAHNETLQSSFFSTILAHSVPPYDGYTTDYLTAAVTSIDSFEVQCQALNGVFYRSNVHLYCGKYTLHFLNYPFCVSRSCDSLQFITVLQQEAYPVLGAKVQENGFYCRGYPTVQHTTKYVTVGLSGMALGALLASVSVWYLLHRRRETQSVLLPNDDYVTVTG